MPNKTVLVLGGGGAVGIAYHCGTLRALEEVGGVDVRGAELLIGTSGGAVMAAELALGRTYDEIAAGVAPDDAGDEESTNPLRPAWQSKADLARRAVGSSYIVARTTMPMAWRMPEPPRWMQRAFPGSLFSVGDGDWGPVHYPAEWPDQRLWLVASDLDGGGSRVVLDGESSSGLRATLGEAVMASCAVPVVFPPVRVDGRRLVDGGVGSSTNLDLAARSDADLVIALAPLGYDPRHPPSRLRALARMRFNRQVATESWSVRRAGKRLLVLRPGAEEIHHHSTNVLTRQSNAAVMATAYDATVAQLATPAVRDLLAGKVPVG